MRPVDHVGATQCLSLYTLGRRMTLLPSFAVNREDGSSCLYIPMPSLLGGPTSLALIECMNGYEKKCLQAHLAGNPNWSQSIATPEHEARALTCMREYTATPGVLMLMLTIPAPPAALKRQPEMRFAVTTTPTPLPEGTEAPDVRLSLQAGPISNDLLVALVEECPTDWTVLAMLQLTQVLAGDVGLCSRLRMPTHWRTFCEQEIGEPCPEPWLTLYNNRNSSLGAYAAAYSIYYGVLLYTTEDEEDEDSEELVTDETAGPQTFEN